MSGKAIFLDRDNTLIEDPGYINHPDQVKLLDGVPEALVQLKALGYRLIVASNQSGLARGIVTEEVLADIHNRLKELLAEKGAYLDQIYYCPYHPDGAVEKYRREHSWRKPSPGMLLAAADEMDIDLSSSWLIGNSDRDIDAGLRAGCTTILVEGPAASRQTQPLRSNPHHRAVNIKEAVNIIKQHHRSSRLPVGEDQPVPAQQSLQDEPAARQTPPPAEQPTEAEPGAEQPEQPQEPQPVQDLLTDPPQAADQTTQKLLNNILEQLRSMERTDMFTEFSVTRLLAGIAQVAALFCLVLSIWTLLAPVRQDSTVLIAVGFAVLFQLMSLTFFTTHGPK
ncbi:MAG: D-glycero-alpha-D-manno-heptose-1,7-bisphosphate 7-phosphatase [Planctomycetota bacterium]|jgi:D,D-heptose 1,7-bisphosphate phosphatase